MFEFLVIFGFMYGLVNILHGICYWFECRQRDSIAGDTEVF